MGSASTAAGVQRGISPAAAALRIAALDVDGTLIAGQLGARLPRMLLDAGLVSRDHWARLHEYLATLPPDGFEDRAVVEQAYGLYAAMLRGVLCAAVDGVVQRLWEQQRDELFGFVEPLIADLRAAGFVPMLISGGMHELLALAAGSLGVERFSGMRLGTSDGVYSGDVSPPAPKHEVAHALAAGRPIGWPESLAAGDSLADAELLQRVGHPYAFEPSPALGLRARQAGWPVVDRDTLGPLLRSRLGIAGPKSVVPPTPRQHADDPGQALRDAQRRLSAHVIAQLDARGAMAGGCESRVVESSMMLTLLRREHRLPAVQDDLQSFLVRCAPGAQIFDATLIDAVLRAVRVSDPDPIIDRTLAGTDHSGVGRKRLALSAVLAVVDAAPFTRCVPAEAFEPHIEVPWTRLLLRAVTVLFLAEYGSPEGPELDELIAMLDVGQRRGVFEKHLFTHLMALLALNRARPGHPLIAEGVAHLAACQNPDGGMPFVVDLEIFATATGGLALTAADADLGILEAIGAFLVRHQGADGGWPFASDVLQSDVDDTAQAVRVLHAIDSARYGVAIARGRDFLRAIAGPDGGFPTYRPGQRSEPAMTASAITALAPRAFADAPTLDAAAGFLLAAQRPDGTFGRGWSLCESAGIGLAVIAMRSMHAGNPAKHRGRIGASIAAGHHRLLYTAHEDGGWGQTPAHRSDAISTAYSLIALARTHAKSPQVRRAVDYLVGQQCADGGYVSPPDQTGPRPLPFDIPTLVDNVVLLAMAHLSAVLSGEAGYGPPALPPPGTHVPRGL